MMESRVEALEKTLTIGIQLSEGFEERLVARLSLRDADLEDRFLQQDSRIAWLRRLVERLVHEGGGKNPSAKNTVNQRVSTVIAPRGVSR